jgi:hypothetical protein
MKFYVAARFGKKEEVKRIYEMLMGLGQEIVYDWTEEDPVKPYGENEELANEISVRMINASESCDVFVLISDEAGTDMYGELGSAITSEKPGRIYVIGDFLDRSKLFFHPNVKRMKTIEDVLEDLELTQ